LNSLKNMSVLKFANVSNLEMGNDSSKKSKKDQEKKVASGYPTQGAQPSYPTNEKPAQFNPPIAPPTQPGYPAAGQPYPPPTQPGYPPVQSGPPPGYAPAQYGAPPPVQYGAPPPGQYGQAGMPPPPPGYHPQYAPPGGQHQSFQQQGVQYQVAPNQFQPGQTVIVPTGFDSGARFQGGQSSVPPPPPGCAPNAAQVAIGQGANVQVGQKAENFMTGGKGGGYTFW
jgi:hypothetical protein